jgi:hypothetical protein
MLRSRRIQLVLCLALLMTVGATTVGASSAVGTQNPQFTVATFVTSSGEDPDRATVGDTVTVVTSVTNNTARSRTVTVILTLTTPSGETYSESRRVTLASHETITDSFSYVVDPSYPTGLYRLRIAARNAQGTSRATARLEIY